MAKETTQDVIFHELPTSFDVFLNIAESILNLPEKVAALFVVALRVYSVDKDLGLQMLSYLRHEENLDKNEIQKLLIEPMKASPYIPLAYFKGATPENGYTPILPYVVTVKNDKKHSRGRKVKTLYIGSPGAGMYRPITLEKIKKKKIKNKNLLGDPWFVTEYTSLTLPVPKPTEKSL